MNKKGLLSLGQLTGIILLLVVIGIMLVIAIRINTELADSLPSATLEQNKSRDAAFNSTQGMVNISENQGLLGTIIIFSIIISVVVVGFAVRGGVGF